MPGHCACSAVADLQVEQKPLCCCQKLQPSAFPILAFFLHSYSTVVSSCLSSLASYGYGCGLCKCKDPAVPSCELSVPQTESTSHRRGHCWPQSQREARPGQCCPPRCLSWIKHLLAEGLCTSGCQRPCQNASQLWVTLLVSAIIATSTALTHRHRCNP